MSILKKSMLIEPHDNVAVAVEPIEAGEATMVGGEEIVANQFIKEGHKIARTDIAKGDEIIKYGVHIGVATQDIKKGDWVHENNVYDDFEEINQKQRAYYRSMAPDALDYTDPRIYTKEELHLPETIMGYKRADGSFGIRNQVLVISLVQCSNNAAQRISNACNVPATFVDAACGEFPDRFARTLKGFITAGTHPNTFGVVLLSLGCQQTNPEEVAEAIRKTGRPVVNISIQSDGGVTKAIADGILNGSETIADTLMAKTVPYCDVDLPVRSYDVVKANELMEKAGWSMGKDGYRYKDGKKCAVTIYYNSNNSQERTISEYMQNDLKKIGVELKIVGEEKQAFLDRQRTGEFDLQYSLSWGTPYDPQSYLSSWRIPAHGDYQAQVGLERKEWLDKTITALMIEPNEDTRKNTYKELLAYIHEQGVYVPLSYSRTKAVHVPALKGVTFCTSQYEIPFERMSF